MMTSNQKKMTVNDALNFAQQQQIQGNLQNAVSICEGILKEHPNHFDSLHLLGVLAYQCGKDKVSIECISRALIQQPKHLDALSNIAAAYINLGDYAAAEKYCLNALKINDKSIGALANLGNVYKKQGDFEAAKKYYKKVISLSQSYVSTLSNLASIANLEGDHKLAEEYAQKAVDKDNKQDNALFNLALAKEKQGKTEEALNTYKATLEININHVSALNNMGAIFLSIGRVEDSLALLNRAYKLAPSSVNVLINLAAVNVHLKKYNEAFEYYNKALEITPANEKLELNIAELLRETGDLSAAEKVFEKLMPHQKAGTVTIYLARIKLGFSCHDYRLVIKLAQEALKLNNLSLWQSVDLNISLAMASWLLVDYRLTKSALLKARSDFQEMAKLVEQGQEFSYVDSKTINAYFLLLEKLIIEVDNTQFFDIEKTTINNLFVIGESHSMIFNNQNIDGNFLSSKLVVGAKIWHLIQDKPNAVKSSFTKALDSIKKESKVVFVFGEIDCRPDEGIIEYAKKSGEEISDIIEYMLSKYLELIIQESSRRKLTPIVYGVPAPLLNSEVNHNDSFLDLVALFNEKLKILTKTNGLQFIDVYAKTCGDNKCATGEAHLDGYHIKPKIINELLQVIAR